MTARVSAGRLDYDVVVLGAGAPGVWCATALAEGGLRVAIVQRDLIGHECLYRDFAASMALLRYGEAVHSARAVGASVEVDVDAALAWRDRLVAEWSGALHELHIASSGVDLLPGTGRVVAPGVVEVDGRPRTTQHVVVATGSDPVAPELPGLARVGVWGARDVAGMKARPRRMLVLGGGPVGVETAQAFHRLGATVVLVESAEHVLPREPAPLGAALGKALEQDGIHLVLGAMATAVHREDRDYVVDTDDGRELRGDRLIMASGRRPRAGGLGLESVGVRTDDHGVVVDAHLYAGMGVWAIGDVTGSWPVRSVGRYQAGIVAANILGEYRTANYEAVPRVVLTDPQAAAVGATAARYSGTAQLTGRTVSTTDELTCSGSDGFLTLLSDGERLTGAYALGPGAGEWLQQATLAVRAHVPLEVLRDVIQPFPSLSETYRAALEAMDST